jgi:hypothetical protein
MTENVVASTALREKGVGMRIIDCPCGHRLGASSDDVLFLLAREHVDRDHPELQRTDEQIWERIRKDAYDS